MVKLGLRLETVFFPRLEVGCVAVRTADMGSVRVDLAS